MLLNYVTIKIFFEKTKHCLKNEINFFPAKKKNKTWGLPASKISSCKWGLAGWGQIALRLYFQQPAGDVGKCEVHFEGGVGRFLRVALAQKKG